MTASAVVYEFQKNHREVVRATLQEFEGRDVIDLRAFLPRSSDGVLVPTPKGLTVDRCLLPHLEAAVRALRDADSISERSMNHSLGEPT